MAKCTVEATIHIDVKPILSWIAYLMYTDRTLYYMDAEAELIALIEQNTTVSIGNKEKK